MNVAPGSGGYCVLFLLLTVEVKIIIGLRPVRVYACVCACVRACAPLSACERYLRSERLRLQQRSGQEFTGLPQTPDFSFFVCSFVGVFFFFLSSHFSVIVDETSERSSEGEAAPRTSPEPLMDTS